MIDAISLTSDEAVQTRLLSLAQDGFHGIPEAVVAGELVFTRGLFATENVRDVGSDGVRRLTPRWRTHPVSSQTRDIFDRLDGILSACGGNLQGLVRLDQHCVERSNADPYISARNEFLHTERPASVLVAGNPLLSDDAYIQVEAVATTGSRTIGTSEGLTYNEQGGYSQAVVHGDLVFISGAVAADLESAAPYPGGRGTGLAEKARIDPNFWYGSSIRSQTRWIIENKLAPMLAAGDSSLESTIQAQVYLRDPERDLAGFMEEWASIFPDSGPALAIYFGTSFGAVGADVEICFIAARDSSVRIDRSGRGSLVDPSLSRVGPYAFSSTYLPRSNSNNVGTPALHETPDTIAQLASILETVDSELRSLDGDLSSVVKAKISLDNLRDYRAVVEFWRACIGNMLPAFSFIGTPGGLPVVGGQIALDIVAYLPDGPTESPPTRYFAGAGG